MPDYPPGTESEGCLSRRFSDFAHVLSRSQGLSVARQTASKPHTPVILPSQTEREASSTPYAEAI